MKKRAIKQLSLGLCFLVSTSLFAGFSTAASKQYRKMETITVWSNNASQKTEDEKMVADYNKGEGKSKGIYIDYKVFGGDYNNVLKIALAAGEGPDMYKNIDSSYVRSGVAIPLEDLPGAKEWLKNYKGLLLNNVSVFNGKVYTVPYNAVTCAVAYNKDLLKKNGFSNPPKTWSELAMMARTITKNGDGKEFGYIEGLKSTGYAGWNGLWQGITGTGHPEWNPVTGKYDYASFAPFLQIIADLKKDNCWFPGSEGLNNDGARAQFAQGNVGFKLSGSWDVGVWTSQFPAKMNWGFCRPVMDEKNAYKYIALLAPSFAIGTKAKAHPEKVLEVFKLWHSAHAEAVLYKAGKSVPFKTSISKGSPAPADKNWAYISDISKGLNYPPMPSNDIIIEGDSAQQTILKVILGVVSAKEGLADLDKRANAAVEKAKANGLDVSGFMVKKLDNKVK